MQTTFGGWDPIKGISDWRRGIIREEGSRPLEKPFMPVLPIRIKEKHGLADGMINLIG
jgi:hypothetical protein